jgi:hypothetical protein
MRSFDIAVQLWHLDALTAAVKRLTHIEKQKRLFDAGDRVQAALEHHAEEQWAQIGVMRAHVQTRGTSEGTSGI